EQRHSKQNMPELKDGSLFLEVPYNNDIELIMDILRYGENITVLSPDSLRERIKSILNQMVENYRV
ncbi:MAG: WYL domain-containing protein, partial [Proteobacteria bacterium]|nr:WYL domain-containing protein [Pseudomonadota bacterium]